MPVMKPKIVKTDKAVSEEVIYPLYVVRAYLADPKTADPSLPSQGPITVELAKKILGWESEEEAATRLGTKKSTFADPLLTDENGQGVMCLNNCGNRPFDLEHAKSLAQDTLSKKWQFNMENIILSRTGKVISGQHRLIGLVLAYQLWAGEKQGEYWRSIWKTEPYIESLIAFGGSDDFDTIQTIDNVKPRNESDVIFTSPIFAKVETRKRKELSKNLAAANDLLWKRTGAGQDQEFWSHYQTHSSSLDFLERHGTLKNWVNTIFEHNENRSISITKLSPGQCAAMAYLMSCAESDGDAYRSSCPRNEKGLNFKKQNEAEKFWESFAVPTMDENDNVTDPIRLALIDLYKAGGGKGIEKRAIIAKAWRLWSDKEEITKEALTLQRDIDGELEERPSLGGIDTGDDPSEREEIIPTPDEIRAAQAEEMQRKHAERKKLNGQPPQALAQITPIEEQYREGKKRQPGCILIFKDDDTYATILEDAPIVAKVLKLHPGKYQGVLSCRFSVEKLDANLKKLILAGHRVAICEKVDDVETVKPVTVVSPIPPGPKPAAKK